MYVRLIRANTLLKEDNILSMQFQSFIDVLLHHRTTQSKLVIWVSTQSFLEYWGTAS